MDLQPRIDSLELLEHQLEAITAQVAADGASPELMEAAARLAAAAQQQINENAALLVVGKVIESISDTGNVP